MTGIFQTSIFVPALFAPGMLAGSIVVASPWAISGVVRPVDGEASLLVRSGDFTSGVDLMRTESFDTGVLMRPSES